MQTHQQQLQSRLEGFGLNSDCDLVRRLTLAMLIFGGTLEILYSLIFRAPGWTDLVAVLLTALAIVWLLTLGRRVQNPRTLIPPVALGIAALTLIVIGDGVEVGMSFLFLPAALVMVFYWDDLPVKLAVMLPVCALLVAVPALYGDRNSLIEAVTMLPLLLGSTVVLGATFNRFRQASVEQARFRGTINALMMALDARDDHTAEHCQEVLDLVMMVSEEIGLDPDDTLHAADVALLHDVGKIGIPNEILLKPASLDDEEWAVMRRHPEIGERILRKVPGFEAVARAVRHEHEHWDGGGYPDGLKGEEIPVASRIVLACDAYHAMISERPYRSAMSVAQAREELRAGAGTQFDPGVVEPLLTALEARR
jgi:HD-GYP domain-containing protein (c-di-GMP phosphodiesterase class II)